MRPCGAAAAFSVTTAAFVVATAITIGIIMVVGRTAPVVVVPTASPGTVPKGPVLMGAGTPLSLFPLFQLVVDGLVSGEPFHFAPIIVDVGVPCNTL